MEQGGEGRFLVFLGLSHVYRRPHVIKLVFVFILLICLFTGALSQEPRRVEGKLFFLPCLMDQVRVCRVALGLEEGGLLLPGSGSTKPSAWPPEPWTAHSAGPLAQGSEEDQSEDWAWKRLEGLLHEDSAE